MKFRVKEALETVGLDYEEVKDKSPSTFGDRNGARPSRALS
ncbi:MAG: hypothetical protein ACLUHK_01560 [Eubacteriales bacterium]